MKQMMRESPIYNLVCVRVHIVYSVFENEIGTQIMWRASIKDLDMSKK
jgi:hypothetical protein